MDGFESTPSVNYDQKAILDAVDEYTLYCFYTGIDGIAPGNVYHSPIRYDERPSFVFFESRKYGDCEYLWKDMALGESGGIFKLIKLRYGLATYQDVYALICSDFALSDKAVDVEVPKIELYPRPTGESVRLEVSIMPFDDKGRSYWRQFSIEEDLLELYGVNQIDAYWTLRGGSRMIQDVWHPTFCYDIGGYYQIYSPYAPRLCKFRNDLPENYFFGYIQLPQGGDTLIIDKSAKDTIFCRRLGLWAVAGKSETTPIPHHKMEELRQRFTNVYLMLDNDKAGKLQTEKYMEQYPWLKPRFLSEAKDKTDLCLKVGFERTKETIYKLLEL